MIRNFKLIVSYDGTRYFGWEHQQETELTIQGRLETVLTRMVDRDPADPVTVIGAGSVVTKDIPAWTIATGRPAKVVKKIPERETVGE